MQQPTFTDQEIDALKEIVQDWISEGFTTPPYKDSIASVIRKLDSESFVKQCYPQRGL